MSMTFTPRTGPSTVTKIHYKKYRLPRKQKKLLKKKGLYDKTSLHYKELMYRIMEAARGISKLGRKGTANQIPQGFVYAPYMPMVETIQIDPKDLDLSKYSQSVWGTYYVAPDDQIILGNISI